ncbi:MAG: hypothetical protein AAFR52_20120, partial [Pseudomonadota bacterium]
AGELIEMTRGIVPDLCRVARTSHHCAMYIGNGHAAWEAALANTIAPGDLVLVPATGRFGHGWADMAQGLGAETQIIDFGKSSPVDPGRGVGFDRPAPVTTAPVTTAPVPAAAPVTAAPLPPAGPQSALAPPRPAATTAPATSAAAQSTEAELAQIAAQNDASAAAANSGQNVVNASPSNAPPPLIDNPGLSNETDFNAVSSRRSIEGDAARQAQNRAQYTVVQPTDLPSRAATGPNVVQYALQTSHPVGQRVHRRVSVASAARTQRNCAGYASADDAQAAFLARGGPQRDRMNLDPDGDGYACGWNPAPFRRAAGG